MTWRDPEWPCEACHHRTWREQTARWAGGLQPVDICALEASGQVWARSASRICRLIPKWSKSRHFPLFFPFFPRLAPVTFLSQGSTAHCFSFPFSGSRGSIFEYEIVRVNCWCLEFQICLCATAFTWFRHVSPIHIIFHLYIDHRPLRNK